MAHVNPSRLQSPVERRLRDALLAHEALRRAPETLGSARRWLAQALRLTSTTAPAVMEALSACQEALESAGPVEVFVQPEAVCRALALQVPGRAPTLLLTSRLVEVLSPAELRFALGRALGHQVLGHLELPALASAMTETPVWRSVSQDVILQASLWRQAAKVSADRAGLLCARDPEAAASALFKLSSGLSTASVKAEFRARTQEVEALFATSGVHPTARAPEEVLGDFGTLPFSAPRLRALAAFSLTRTFRDSAGQYASEEGHPDEEADVLLEREIHALEPSPQEQTWREHEPREAPLQVRARLLRHHCWRAAAQEGATEKSLSLLLRMAESWAVPTWLIDEALREASQSLD